MAETNRNGRTVAWKKRVKGLAFFLPYSLALDRLGGKLAGRGNTSVFYAGSQGLERNKKGRGRLVWSKGDSTLKGTNALRERGTRGGEGNQNKNENTAHREHHKSQQGTPLRSSF